MKQRYHAKGRCRKIYSTSSSDEMEKCENYTEKFHAMVKEMSMRAVENAKV